MWICVCGIRHEGIESWFACYKSHPREDGRVRINRKSQDRSAAPVWEHPDGRQRNYPPAGAGIHTATVAGS